MAGCSSPRTGEPSRPPAAAAAPRPVLELPGQRADGSILLPNQWSLRPEGSQIVMGDFPVNIAVHPDSRFAAVLHCGHGSHEIVVVDLSTRRIVSRVSVPEAFYGLAFSSDGAHLFCSGASDETVHSFEFRDGYLWNHRAFQIRDVKETGIPAGLDLRKDSRELYVANLWAHRISRLDLASGAVRDIPLGTNTIMTAGSARAANLDPDLAAASKRDEALLVPIQDANPFPYTCLLDENKDRLYVSLWGQASIAVLDLKTGQVASRWPTEEHPNEMVLAGSGKYLCVANANRNTVTILDTESGRPLETLFCQFEADAPPAQPRTAWR